MSGKGKKKRRAARGWLEASGRARTNATVPAAPAGGLHFTVGAGVSVEPATEKLTLKNDTRLLKAGLLYADRVRLASVGSSLTLRMLDDAGSGPERRLDFLERFFRDTVSRDDPENAAVGIEVIRDYRELRHGRNLDRDQLARRLAYSREIGEAWVRFRTRWEGIAREAGVDEILAARRSGLVDIDGFAAGGVESGAGLTPDAAELRSDEFFEAVAAELFGMLSGAVESGRTHPMLDEQAAQMVRFGVDAGEIPVTEIGRSRGRHGGLASDLLRRLPMFDAASVDEVLDIRRALDGPLVKFRGEVLKFSDGMRTEGWDEDFAADAEDVFVREVDPAVREIEEMVEHDNDLKTLLTRVSRMQEWGASAGLGMLAYNLASLPELASLAVAGGVGLAAAVRNERVEHAEALREIQGHRLFFYREAGRRMEDAGR